MSERHHGLKDLGKYQKYCVFTMLRSLPSKTLIIMIRYALRIERKKTVLGKRFLLYRFYLWR